MIIDTMHQVNANNNNQIQKTDRHLRPRYLGMWGTLTGALSANPKVYHNRDGSRTYLFRMDVESRTGNPNNDQLNHKASLVAYVPSGHTDYCAGLSEGDGIKVRYVVQTDYYLNKEGRPTKKTCLRATCVYPIHQEARSEAKRVESPSPLASQRAGLPASRKSFRSRPNRQDSGMGRGRA